MRTIRWCSRTRLTVGDRRRSDRHNPRTGAQHRPTGMARWGHDGLARRPRRVPAIRRSRRARRRRSRRPSGKVIGLLGPNGAGKTTLMRIIFGVLDPDAGTIEWKGRQATADDRRSWGYMPQERGLYRDMRVADHLVWIARLHGLDKRVAQERGARPARPARPRGPRPRHDPRPVGRDGAARATRGGDGPRARPDRARRAVRRPRPGRGGVPVAGRARPRRRGAQRALLQPPARPRRGPLRDDHVDRPGSGRAPRRRPHAEAGEPRSLPPRRRRRRSGVARRGAGRRSNESTPTAHGSSSVTSPTPPRSSTSSGPTARCTTSGSTRRRCRSSSWRPRRLVVPATRPTMRWTTR